VFAAMLASATFTHGGELSLIRRSYTTVVNPAMQKGRVFTKTPEMRSWRSARCRHSLVLVCGTALQMQRPWFGAVGHLSSSTTVYAGNRRRSRPGLENFVL
jgi:hypothetical protein